MTASTRSPRHSSSCRLRRPDERPCSMHRRQTSHVHDATGAGWRAPPAGGQREVTSRAPVGRRRIGLALVTRRSQRGAVRCGRNVAVGLDLLVPVHTWRSSMTSGFEMPTRFVKRHPLILAALSFILAGCGSSATQGSYPVTSASAVPLPVLTLEGTSPVVVIVPVSVANSAPATMTTTATRPSPPPQPPTTAGAAASTASGGIEGVVVAGPSCPVATPDRPCPPKPVAAHVIVTTPTGQAVASTDSDASGRYRLVVAAGTYVVQVGGGSFSRCAPVTVTATAAFVTVDISCDTGIR